MIGKVAVRLSFEGALNYVLQDKKLGAKQDRAEVLHYNRCFGSAKEIRDQMERVRKLNGRVEKPVLSMSLRASEADRLTSDQWREIGEKLAAEFKVEDHQYLVVLHKDSEPNHIHVVANRVGYEGECASAYKDYEKMAKFCRRMEAEYRLKQVLSPKRFLSKAERLQPRQDTRKDRLKNEIAGALGESKSVEDFTQLMKEKNYEVIKKRGIAFVDQQKVYTKGSEVGYSLKNIERKIALKQGLKIENRLDQTKEIMQDCKQELALEQERSFSQKNTNRNR